MQGKFTFYLEQELRRRQINNPRYSLRAFARSLSLTHASLSMYLNHKRKPSKSTRELIESRLLFRKNREDLSVQVDSDGFQKVDQQHHALIGDWIHFAILSYLETAGARMDVRQMARRLSVSESAVSDAIKRLIELKILKKKKNGKWQQCSPSLSVDNDVAMHATKTLHTKLLGKAITTLDQSRFEERVYSGVCMAIDKELIPIARKKIQTFQRSLMRQLEAKGKKNQVYYLTLQMFPLLKDEI